MRRGIISPAHELVDLSVVGKPPMLPTEVVGVIAVGVDGRVVTSAKATVPFLARLTGQGVESGDANSRRSSGSMFRCQCHTRLLR